MKPSSFILLRTIIIWVVLSLIISHIITSIFGNSLIGIIIGGLFCLGMVYGWMMIYRFIKGKKEDRLARMRENVSKNRISSLEL